MAAVLRRISSVLIWSGVVVLGAFGLYFTFANYPLFGAAIVLLALVPTVYSERNRRNRQRAWEARRLDRARRDDLSSG
jgi:hypothetical protein